MHERTAERTEEQLQNEITCVCLAGGTGGGLGLSFKSRRTNHVTMALAHGPSKPCTSLEKVTPLAPSTGLTSL